MNIEVLKSFEKDIAKVRNKALSIKVLATIKSIETCQNLSEIPHLKKMIGYERYYRIKLGEYRIGLKIEKDNVTLIRFMDRKDIYKYFP